MAATGSDHTPPPARDALLEPVLDHVDKVSTQVGQVVEQVREAIAEVKPRLRGWLHLGVAPLTLLSGIVLVLLAPTTTTKVGAAVFTGAAVLLFGVSAIYHAGTWSPRTADLLRRFDHANIFLLIAGSYTPYCLLFLHGSQRTTLLLIVWIGAGLGCVFGIAWVDAPRKLHTPIYVVLGWVVVFFLPGLIEGARAMPDHVGAVTLVLLGVGGVLYMIGSVVYGVRRPNPWPATFGFHEVFHSFTILAFASQYVGISLATYALR